MIKNNKIFKKNEEIIEINRKNLKSENVGR